MNRETIVYLVIENEWGGNCVLAVTDSKEEAEALQIHIKEYHNTETLIEEWILGDGILPDGYDAYEVAFAGDNEISYCTNFAIDHRRRAQKVWSPLFSSGNSRRAIVWATDEAHAIARAQAAVLGLRELERARNG